jgi:uncharacterized protein (TIGR02099 family)
MERRKRRWWTRLTTIVAILILLAAGLSLGFKFLVDAVPGYRGKVEAAVGQAINRPVSIGAMALTWRRLRPTLEFRDLAVLDRDTHQPLMRAARLRMGSSIGRLLSADTMPAWVEIVGVDVDADIDLEGRWSIRGIDLSSNPSGESPLKNLDRVDRVQITDSHFLLRDLRLGRQARLQPLALLLDRATVTRSGNTYTAEASLRPPAAIADTATLHADLSGTPDDRSSWQGEVQVTVEGVRGWPWLAARLPADMRLLLEDANAQATLKISGGQPRSGSVRAAAASIALVKGSAATAALHQLDLLSTFERIPSGDPGSVADGWHLDITKLALEGAHGAWPAQTAQVDITPQGVNLDHGVAIAAQLGLIRLDDVMPWAVAFTALPDVAHRAIGDVTDIHLELRPGAAAALSALRLDARLRGVGLTPKDDQPALSGLDGSLHFEGSGGTLTLTDASPTLTLPTLFTQPITPAAVSTAFSWSRAAQGWHLSAPAFAVKLASAQARGSLDLDLAEDGKTPPRMKLVADLSSDDVVLLKDLMPLTWGEKTREWLGRALVKGRVPRGHLVVDGPLVPRDDAHPDGTPWTLDLDVADGTLAFSSDWPAAEKIAAHLRFRDHGMTINSHAGAMAGSAVQQIEAEIADFREPLLTLDGKSAGEAADYYRLLRDSPLKTRLGSLLDKTDAHGPVALDLHLEIPLHAEHIDAHASGTVVFGNDEHGAELTVHGLSEPIRDIHGQLEFAKGVTAEQLTGRAFATPVRAVIREQVAADGSLIDTLIADFTADTRDAAGPMTAFVPGWLRGALDGSSAFQLRLPFSGPESGHVIIASELRGIRSQLPPPLAKKAAETLPLNIRIGGARTTAAADAEAPQHVLIAARGDALRVALRFANDEAGVSHTRGVEVRLGPGPEPTAEADGVIVTGAPDELDGPGWAEALSAIGGGSAGSGLAFRSADLRPATLKLRNTAVHDVHLLATGVPGGVHTTLDGAGAAGEVDWLREDGGRVRVRLQHLALDAVTNVPPNATALADSLADAADDREASGRTPFDPQRAPVVDADIGAFGIGGVDFGRVKFVTTRIDEGQRIDTLTIAGGKLDLTANGSWRRRNQQSNASISLELASPDIGDVLTALGYAKTLSARHARFSGSLEWPRQPEGLELAQAQGSLELEVEKGQLKAVEPGGTGRLLGLLNLYALPRRFLLDFRDVAGQGLAFDTLNGSFVLADGQATTDDLDIVSPSLKIQLRGRIGLAARDYDQRVTVRPDLSTGVTVGATLLGGPVAGGIALVVQKLAGKPLSALTQYSYRVTGSWDDPQIDKAIDKGSDKPIDKNQAGRPAADAPPAAGDPPG